MKKNIILLILFPIIALGFGSLVEKKIDTIVPPSGTLTLENTIVIDSATGDTVPYLNGSKEFTSSIISQVELEHLDGITQNVNTALDTLDSKIDTTSQDLQTNIDGKVSLTGAETVAGDKTLSGNTEFSNTGAILVSRGATGDRPTPTNGHFRYNSTLDEFEGVTGGVWGSIGGSVDLSVVTQDMIPDTDISYDIGTLLLRWKDVFTENISTKIITASQSVTPATPTSGNLLYFKADDNLYKLNSAGTEQQVGALLDLSAVTQDIIPDTDISYDIGTAALKFDNAWIETVTLNEVQSDGKIEVTSTTQSSIPCPVMTRAEMEAIATPTNGSCVFNSTDNAQFHYNLSLTEWVIAGSVHLEKNSEAVTSTGFTSREGGTEFVLLANEPRSSNSAVVSVTSSGHTRYTFLKDATFSASANSVTLNSVLEIRHFNSGGTIITSSNGYTGTFQRESSALSGFANEGDYIVLYANQNLTNDYYTNFTVSANTLNTFASTTCEGLKCFNEFSAKVANNGTATITSQNLDFIDTVTRTAVGEIQVNYKAGFFTQTPTVVVQQNQYERIVGLPTSTATGFLIRVEERGTGNSLDEDIDFIVQRQGADFFDHDERFIPISDQENVYSAYIDYQGTVQSESSDFIQGNCPITAASQYTCTYKTSFTLAQAMSCVTTSEDASEFHSVLASTSTYFSSKGINDGGAAATSGFYVVCQKQGADYKEPKAYVGNLNPKTLVETPGSNKPKMFSSRISATGVVSREYGEFLNGNCSTSNCSFNVGVWTQIPNCVAISANVQTFCNPDVTSLTNVNMNCYSYTGGGSNAVVKNLICHGE